MGLIQAALTLSNAADAARASIQVVSLVDTGALHLCIPESMARRLGYDLASAPQREVLLASGHKTRCPYVGPIKIQFKDRACFVGALVLGDQVLLGAVPMEDLDLVISPSRLSIEVNPNSPQLPRSIVKLLTPASPHLTHERTIPRGM